MHRVARLVLTAALVFGGVAPVVPFILTSLTHRGVTIVGSDGREADQHAAEIIADVLEWLTTDPMPDAAGTLDALSFTVFDHRQPERSGAECGGYRETQKDMMAYCRPNRTVLWDIGTPRDAPTMTFVLAHEIAHHVDEMLELRADRRDVLAGEQFADCISGAFFRSTDPAPDEVDTARRVVSQWGDDARMKEFGVWDEAEYMAGLFNLYRHGTGQERVRAWSVGYEAGAAECHRVMHTPRVSDMWLAANGKAA